MVAVGILTEGALLLLEMSPIVHRLAVVDKTVNGDNLSSVGEERGIDLESRVGVVFVIEFHDFVLQFGSFDGAVVDNNDHEVLWRFRGFVF